MSKSIEALSQQLDACKAELASKEASIAESMETMRQTLAILEEKMAALSAGDEPSIPVALISDTPYPEQQLAGFVPLKVLAEERELLAGHIQTVRDSEFFDAQWYLETYPDIKDSGYADDPAMHYLLFGGFEGRHPGPSFNTIAYYLEYPDIYRNQLNPLVHFLTYGIQEGRKAYPL